MSNLSRKCRVDINTKSEVLDSAVFFENDVVWNFPMFKNLKLHVYENRQQLKLLLVINVSITPLFALLQNVLTPVAHIVV
jgi:hypothetical protein